MGGSSCLKRCLLALLLVLLLVSINFDACKAARRGKHWRSSRADSSSLAKKKSKGKNAGSSHHVGGSPSYGKKPSPGAKQTPSPSPSPSNAPSSGPNPSPAPSPKTSPSSTPSPAPSPKSVLSPIPKQSPKTSPSPKSSPAPSPKSVPSPIPKQSPKTSPSPKSSPAPSPKSSPSPIPKQSPKTSSSPKSSSAPSPKTGPSPKPSPAPSPKTSPSSKPNPKTNPGYPPSMQEAVFDVLDFGAKGDGVSDDTKAFQAAWAAACKVEASTVVVPSEYEFLVGPISFSGPYCEPNIVFQLDGTIVAPTSTKVWGSGILQWLEFSKLKGITIRGSGVIEGRGSVWWTNNQFDFEPISNELVGIMPHIKPTALRFYGSYNVTVTGITIQNSPQCHLKFDNCVGVEVFNMTISSPGDSLNTDGIHLQNSKDVAIHHSQLACGDDCVSIQTGSSNIYIHHVNCGPGHGISIGGLGRDNTKACVSNITVQNVELQGTMTGVRIKTWQGGSGSVQNVRFANIKVTEVQMPIVIDQFYCDRSSCRNQSQAVALTGISYENIKGTFTVKPVHFACSDSFPCSDVTLNEIELQPLQERYHMYNPFCWQTYGMLRTPTLPPIECLQTGKPARNQVQSDPDSC